MAYFVFHLIKGSNGVVREAELKESFPEYREMQKPMHDNLEKHLKLKDVSDIKIMFADNEDLAEAKLTENRDAPILREWEK